MFVFFKGGLRSPISTTLTFHKAQAEAWYNDPAYQEAMKFRQAASTMNYLLIQEGGENTGDLDPEVVKSTINTTKKESL